MNKKNVYSLRKLSVGLASVIVGTCFFMCVGHDITSSPLKYGSRVFVAKCSEPQAGNGDVMSEGSG